MREFLSRSIENTVCHVSPASLSIVLVGAAKSRSCPAACTTFDRLAGFGVLGLGLALLAMGTVAGEGLSLVVVLSAGREG